MADLEEAEEQAAGHVGLDNDSHGRILSRLIRQLRFVTNRQPILAGRIQSLEDRVAALEQRLPPA